MDGTSKEFEMTIPRIFISCQLCLEDQVKVVIGPEYAIGCTGYPKKITVGNFDWSYCRLVSLYQTVVILIQYMWRYQPHADLACHIPRLYHNIINYLLNQHFIISVVSESFFFFFLCYRNWGLEGRLPHMKIKFITLVISSCVYFPQLIKKGIEEKLSNMKIRCSLCCLTIYLVFLKVVMNEDERFWIF